MNQELAELLNDFISEAEERLARVEGILMTIAESPPALRTSGLEELRRELHTLKGNSGMMGFDDMQSLAHAMEDRVQSVDPAALELAPLLADLDHFKHLVAEAASGGDAGDVERQEASIRVSLESLDELLDLSAELVVARNRLDLATRDGLERAAGNGSAGGRGLEAWKGVDESRRALDKLLAAVQRRIERLRMVPLRKVFTGLRRLVHDERERAGKRVRLTTHGEDTPLDNSLVELAGEVLGHLVRNAVVHGIEPVEQRRLAGKPATGTVLLSAAVRAHSVVIEVIDDGAGIDRRAILAAAERAGLEGAEEMALQELIFHPGLSSRADADSSAGRGIGLAAVGASARRFGGAIEVDSRPGVGTRVRLQLPLAVAVTEALLVEVGEQEYALPAAAVLETVEIDTADRSRGAVTLGDREIPLVDLASFFELDRESARGAYGVILEAEGRQRSLIVDELGDLREIVVHRVEDAAAVPGVGGTTILGDGRVVLILDPPVLTAAAAAA